MILAAEEVQAVTEDTVFIERFAAPTCRSPSSAPTVAVKDLVAVAGSVTTAGCRAVGERGLVATTDASCIEVMKAAGAVLVGKTNLHELAFGTSGVNPWYGTPGNPVDPGRIPGGSSSGSAVAVALGLADVAIGSDTGGSIRIPAACCGVVGLKTTHGCLSMEGVWPLAPSFDTIGPMGASVAAVATGARLLGIIGEGGGAAVPDRVARLDLGPSVPVDPEIDEAVDEALQKAGLFGDHLAVPRWQEARHAQQVLLGLEARGILAALVAECGGNGISKETLARLERSDVTAATERTALGVARSWGETFARLVAEREAVVLPTLAIRPPRLEEAVTHLNILTAPVNLVGLPAVSVPVPRSRSALGSGGPPAGLQLVGPPNSEAMLLALAARVEAAAAS
ncbi:MAG: amidase [Acidimicrobiales bacterium]